MKTLLAILDTPSDARLLSEMLREQSNQIIVLLHAKNMADAEVFLAEHTIDFILLDFELADVQGLEAVRQARSAAPQLPIVVLTCLNHEWIAAQALHEGAQDYLVKGQIDLRGFLRALRYAVERKQMEDTARDMAQMIAHTARHDDLTGLPNRGLLKDRIDYAITLATQCGTRLAVLYFDMDRFKRVNDSLGHATGDKLLKSIAGRLLGNVRAADTLSRHGSDEFVVLLSEVAIAEDAAITADRILSAVSQTHEIDTHELLITASGGISIFPDDGDSAETLLQNAEAAMYQAKDMGRHRYRFFEPAMKRKAADRQFNENELRRALERQEFELYYQPKIDLCTRRISGVEALIRWNHPTQGLISPARFIPLVEECRLLLPIGAWVLHEACQQAQRWTAAGLRFGTMAVNVSAVQLREGNFAQRVFSTLEAAGMHFNQLELELTESVLMTGENAAAEALQTVRREGVHVALDDFGTGYSSLSYLERFPVDCLKIDQSFIRQIGAVGTKSTIVTAIINMAHTLGLRVVAEGVETEEELAFIIERGCNEAQGFYFSQPLTSSDFSRHLLLANTS